MILQNNSLEEEKENIQKMLVACEQKLSHVDKAIDSIHKGKAKLDEILSVQRPRGTKYGIGYVGESLRAMKDKLEDVFVNAQHQQKEHKRKPKREVPTCFHCGENGHIQPKCNKLKDALKSEKIIGYTQ